jgi:hypothetical protein
MKDRFLVAVFVAIEAPLAAGVGSHTAIAHAAPADAVELRHYTNGEWNSQLDVPTSWVRMPPVPMNSTNEVVRFWSAENGHHGLIIFRNFLEKRPTLEDLRDHIRESLAKGGFSNFVLGEAKIGSRRVLTIDFQSRPDGAGSITYCRHYLLVEGSLGYVLGFGTTTKTAAMFDLFDRMAKSFVFAD